MSRGGRKKRRGRYWQPAGSSGPVALRDLPDSHLANIIQMLETGVLYDPEGAKSYVSEDWREQIHDEWHADMVTERERRSKLPAKTKYKAVFG